MAMNHNALFLSPTCPPVQLSTRVLSILNLFWMTLTSENPLLWSFMSGRAHARADMAGPYYVLGAPNVNFAPGKAVLGATQDLIESPLFLFSGKILGPAGEPVEAILDLWQATTTGVYEFSAYRNRGKVTTDPTTGAFEILTVPPGEYGPTPSLLRAGHIHAVISAPGYESLVTQLYVCPRNNPKMLDTDFLNWLRSKRVGNMLKCWAIPTEKGDRFGNLPEPNESDAETARLVKEWNSRLSNQSAGLRVGCGASDVIKLNKA